MKISLFSILLLFLASSVTRAGSATWNLNPTNSDWNIAANWTPATVPNSTTDTATFVLSNTTDLSLSGIINVAGVVFNVGASSYTFEAPSGAEFVIGGAGVINNSGEVQTISIPPLEGGVSFTNSATAGQMMVYIGNIGFSGTSNAGSSSFIASDSSFLDNSTASAANFTVLEDAFFQFEGFSNAGTATFSIQPATNAVGTGGVAYFRDSASAANATITAEGSAVANPNGRALIDFVDTANAGNATLIAQSGSNGGEGGHIGFDVNSSGGTSRIELFGNGQLDISANLAKGISVGSIEGDGLIFLGARRLTVSDTLDTAFSGVLQDGGVAGGSGGALTKIGSGKLTLSGTNTYTGGTTVTDGTLTINNMTDSGTGTGPVVVSGGTLAGNGTIAGAVTIGGEATMAAILSPAGKKQGTLTLQSTLTFAISSTYTCTYRANNRKIQFDQVIAKGVTINDGSGFNFPGQTQGNLQIGTVLTVINNTSATPIAGRFNNLADGAIISANGGNFQANYEGGDGNDLTLTVVP